jgi:hypothetical protein
MAERNTDIAIFGAGIAGLWTLALLRGLGYDAVLLEKNSIGGGQSIASQGIIHSGLKYALAGKVSDVARSISAMPERWREALSGKGPVDLSAASRETGSQMLLIPHGMVGGIVKIVTEKALGKSAHEIDRESWPEQLKSAGFKGTAVQMSEPVLDIPAIIHALAEPHRDHIRKISAAEDVIGTIKAKAYIFTAAEGNERFARRHHHNGGLETQARPLVMTMIKNAPFPLHAHLVGTSEKPVATITTHHIKDGTPVWYIGGGVAEKPKNTSPANIFQDVRAALKKYLPNVDLSKTQWAALPIDRIEGRSEKYESMPDTPTIHVADNCVYCWPTKLTFAPLLGDMILSYLKNSNIRPGTEKNDWSFLPQAPYSDTPWDKATWI